MTQGDEGISGTALRKREAFLQMMEDCKSRKIDVIYTKSVSRFGRNTVDALESIRTLMEYNVNVIFEKEHIESMKVEGELLLTVLMALSQNESKQQSDNVKWGIRRRYERGEIQSIPLGTLQGYDKNEDGNLVINEKEAEIIRHIYDLYLKGYGRYRISQILEDEGIPSNQGHTKWSWSTVEKILRNEKYRGDMLCQKTYSTNYLTKKKKKNMGELPQYYIENTHPEIIDKRIWDVVKLMHERDKKYEKAHYLNSCHRDTEQLPLIGKMVCKQCGYTFVRRKYKKAKLQHQYYWCCGSFYKNIERHPDKYSITDERPTQLFVEAWNKLLRKKVRYSKVPANVLEEYRREELEELFKQGPLQMFNYERMLQTLDHMEIGEDGYADIYFYAGTMVRVKI
ncbi:recombinase family protein [Lachnospiraceae bacterium MD1]|uniref:Recombinase family protein n=1 Tax=Variimorphobacter saccharofermentans TaxID=2755051 RepID=A0A839K0X0_9FIRM|nr:recombinase family protein [Variimorphobacter saccharofermentans]MBB2183565.1 recombinase family protein [Variimorphobacter saccharofermentans]